MKKVYMKPAMREVELRHRCQLLGISGTNRINAVKGNVFVEEIESDEDYKGEIR